MTISEQIVEMVMKNLPLDIYSDYSADRAERATSALKERLLRNIEEILVEWSADKQIDFKG